MIRGVTLAAACKAFGVNLPTLLGLIDAGLLEADDLTGALLYDAFGARAVLAQQGGDQPAAGASTPSVKMKGNRQEVTASTPEALRAMGGLSVADDIGAVLAKVTDK